MNLLDYNNINAANLAYIDVNSKGCLPLFKHNLSNIDQTLDGGTIATGCIECHWLDKAWLESYDCVTVIGNGIRFS